MIYYYGVNGHGCGLVDAMSGFGVKSLVRRAIVTENFWYESVDELLAFLKKIKSEEVYYYSIIHESELTAFRANKDELPIKGCRKSRMFSFQPDGIYRMKRHLCSCQHCSNGNFNDCVKAASCLHHDIDDSLEDENVLSANDRFEFVETDSFIGLYSASSSFEAFIVCSVKDKAVADDDIIYFYGHLVKKGDRFITGIYLEEDKRKAGRIYYKKHKKDVYSYPGEVFSPAIMLDNQLSMSIQDYLYLCDSI